MGTGELYPVVEWIHAAMWVQFAHWTFSLVVRLFPYRAFFMWESVVFPGRILISHGFSDLPRAPAPLCDHGL